MSCVLRVSGPTVDAALSRISLEPYRVEEGTAHFDVSKAGFAEFAAQLHDAIAFLHDHTADLELMMGEPGMSGVLDFGIESRDDAAQFDRFPAELVRKAASFGLALELSRYPASVERGAEA
jgi:hypothetical protein